MLNCTGPGGTADSTVVVDVTSSEPSATFPLEISSDQRDLIDSYGQPFLINGDTPWSLMVALTDSEVIQYLDDRHARGFNTILANLIEHRFAPDPPRNVYGVAPFTASEDIRTPNDAYFDRCVGIVQQALDRDMLVMMTPAYLGIAGGGEGWWQALSARTTSEVQAYGAYVGAKFAAFPNLVWVMGGDYFAQGVLSRTRALVTGLKSTGRPDWLFTYHAGPNFSSSQVVGNESWLDLNATYAYEDPGLVAQFEQDYGRTPTRPFFLLESRYEHEPDPPVSRLTLRSQAYWAVLTGGMGALFGNNPIWKFENNGPYGSWESNLSSNGSQDRTRFRDLFSTYDWSSLVPDRSHTVLTGGQGSGSDTAYAAKSNDSTLVIIYTPSQRALTVNLDALSGSNATAWWFNPRDGSVDVETALTSTGSQSFIPPTNDDWVLVIADAAANLPPPGTGIVLPIRDFKCGASAQGEGFATLWLLAGLAAWVLFERRRIRRTV
ncbi:MAG: glycoside hydrolase family 140 protein [Polyangiales bacterium]